MIPQSAQEITNQANKYLFLSRPKLPNPNYHVILAHAQEWSKTGHILGNAISHLNFPDNSIIFLSEVNDDSTITLPDLNSSIVLPNSSTLLNQIFIDNYVVSNICKYIPDSIINTNIVSNSINPFIPIPFAIEAARIRKRGVPLCTPILFGNKCDKTKLAVILEQMIIKHGCGVVILNNGLQYENVQEYEKYLLEKISTSFLPEILPLFFPGNSSGLTLLTYLAHRFKSCLNIVCEGQYLDNNSIFTEIVLGISKNKNYDQFSLNNIGLRRKIWNNVLHSLKTLPYITIGCNGSCIIQIKHPDNHVIYDNIIFDPDQDLGESIWKASKDLFDEFPECDTSKYFIDIINIINPEKVTDKILNKYYSEEYLLIFENGNVHNILIEDSIKKTKNKIDVDISESYVYKPYKISLPIDVILLLHDIDYQND